MGVCEIVWISSVPDVAMETADGFKYMPGPGLAASTWVLFHHFMT